MEFPAGKWGNSLAVRLPLGWVEEFGIVEGSMLRMAMLSARLPRIVPKPPSKVRQALAAELRAMHANRPVTRAITKEEMSRY